jgi:hypothetical protein
MAEGARVNTGQRACRRHLGRTHHVIGGNAITLEGHQDVVCFGIVSDRRDQPRPRTEPSGGDRLIEALAACRTQEDITCDAVG